MQNEKNPSGTGDNRSEVEKLMSEHLRNPDHQISDEQLNNVKVGVPSGKAEKDQDKDEEGPAQTTPWDVLGG